MFENFFSQMQQNQQEWRNLFVDQITRLSAMYEQIAKLEEAGVALASAAIDGTSDWYKKALAAGENMRASVRDASQQAMSQAAKPVTSLTQNVEMFRKLAEEHAARVAAYCNEIAKLDHEGTGRLADAVDEYTRLLKESVRYGQQLAAEWRKATLQAAKQTADMMTQAS